MNYLNYSKSGHAVGGAKRKLPKQSISEQEAYFNELRKTKPNLFTVIPDGVSTDKRGFNKSLMRK